MSVVILSHVFSKYKRTENKDITKIHLTAEEPPWDPSTNKCSERDTHMLDQQGQISILVTVAMGVALFSAVILYSQSYDATDVMDDNNLSTALSYTDLDQIELIHNVRKPSIEPIVLAK